MRHVLIVLLLLVLPMAPAQAQVRMQVTAPTVSVGIDLPRYPQLVRVPGQPVYWAPRLAANYFFFDGLYWILNEDGWYASSWYNGPWAVVAPEEVPVYLLRVPVRYYRLPPPYFRGWHPDAPPRWGDRWGDDWRRHHDGWDRWDRRTTVRPAPLPDYQRRYHGPSYPHVEQQPVLHGQHYRYQPRDATVQRTYETQRLREAPPPRSHGDQRPAGPRPQVRDHRR